MGLADTFHFNISLTVLNSLGRDLYRSVNTILGEAISNSWDADAHNVYIYIDRDANDLIIKDDGIGMSADDFQNKFLKIGYSKRKGDHNTSPHGRPYIGRKGIGKLALLSCSERIHIISKQKNSEYVGAIIDNRRIDNDINQDLDSQEHILEVANIGDFGEIINNHKQGTIIKFENLNAGIKNQIGFFRKVIALYYRFSLIDGDFNIYLNDKIITSDELNDLVDDTQIFWMINDLNTDPLVVKLINKNSEGISVGSDFNIELPIKGFIASVKKPSNVKMRGAIDEKLTLDLFVNGRIREKDILRHISKNRIYENYLYGQIHYDSLDDEKDRFTSSREGIKADDEKFKLLLEELRNNIMPTMANEWDRIRVEKKEDGDIENPQIPKRKRKALSLVNDVIDSFTDVHSNETNNDNNKNNRSINEEQLEDRNAKNVKNKIEEWAESLREDAAFNTDSYTECFISENLLRYYIKEKGIKLDENKVKEMKDKVAKTKTDGGINIQIRKTYSDESFLYMKDLSFAIEKTCEPETLRTKTKEYSPMRNAIMHTALLTNEAKLRLTTVYYEIKARLKNLLYGD